MPEWRYSAVLWRSKPSFSALQLREFDDSLWSELTWNDWFLLSQRIWFWWQGPVFCFVGSSERARWSQWVNAADDGLHAECCQATIETRRYQGEIASLKGLIIGKLSHKSAIFQPFLRRLAKAAYLSHHAVIVIIIVIVIGIDVI